MPKPSKIASFGWIQQSSRGRWIPLVLVREEYDFRQLRQDRQLAPLPIYRSELPSTILIVLEEWQDVP